MQLIKSLRFFRFCLAALLTLCVVATSFASEVQVAKDGKALLPIVISPDASKEVVTSAKELADMLSRITGGEFNVTTTATDKAIRLTTAAASPDQPLASKLSSIEPTRREEYIIQSNADGITLLGATDMAAPHAVWDLLHRFGFRQYIPGDRWEIVPNKPTLSIDVDVYEVPDFKHRRIWNGGGYFPYDKEPHDNWIRRNRLGKGFSVATSHVYDKIVLMNKEAFDKHPEYFSLVDGERVRKEGDGNKFCISNEGLQQLCIDWALDRFKRYPDADSVSMEPSDGSGGWCECEPCLDIGTPSDRAVLLANKVCEAINKNSERTRYVGILAYSAHSPPPTKVKPDKRIVVTVAQGFLRGGYTAEELLEHWGNEGVMLGTYDYLGVVQWSWDRPGIGRSTRRSHFEKVVPKHYDRGVRIYIGESEANWGAAGMTYYGVTRVLWDTDERHNAQQMYDGFIADCFAGVEEPMRAFYDMINGDNKPLFSKDLIGRMYHHLEIALNNAEDEGVRNRIIDLILYTRYCDLYEKYLKAEKEEEQAHYEVVMKYVLRIRNHLMVHAREIHRQLDRYNKNVKIPKEAYYKVSYDRNPWVSNEPVTDDEIMQWIKEGKSNNPRFAFEPKSYSLDLVPAAEKLGLTTERRRDFGGGAQGYQEFYVYLDQPRELKLTCTGGLIRHYRDRGDVRIKLFHQSDADDMHIDEARVPPDGEPYPITLNAPQAGLYRIELTDGGDRSKLDWEPDLHMTHIADSATRVNYPLHWSAYFFVPTGTKRIAGYAKYNGGQLFDSQGNLVFDFDKMDGSGFFDVPVPEGQDGTLWQIKHSRHQKLLMTVPPSLARSAEELLLPREVIEAELAKRK